MKERLVVFVVLGWFAFMLLSGTVFAAHPWDDDFNDEVIADHWTVVESPNHPDDFSAAEIDGAYRFTSNGWPVTGNEDDDIAFSALVTPHTLSVDNSFTFSVDFYNAPTVSLSSNESMLLQMGLSASVEDNPGFPEGEDFFAGMSATVDGAEMNYWAGYEHQGQLQPPAEEYEIFATRTQVDGTLNCAYDADTRIASFWASDLPSDVQTFTVPEEIEFTSLFIVGGTNGAEFSSNELYWDNFSITVIPEPSTWILLMCSLPVAALLHRRRRMR